MTQVVEIPDIKKKWTIHRYKDDVAYQAGQPTPVVDGKGNVLPAVSEFEQNVLLNEGINNVLLPALCGTSSPTVYDNANANLGVGSDGTTSESASQTGLQGASTAFAAMDTGYPSVGSQTATWQATFGGTEANQDWKEFTVVNAVDDTGDNLNRKVSDQGTKASGQTWVLTLEITFS